jgi:hypothetical protein
MSVVQNHRAHSIAGQPKSRCSGLKRPVAISILVLLGLLVVASVSTIPTAQGIIDGYQARTENETKLNDSALYRRIAMQVRSGEDYYAVAIESQRDMGYPVRPFLTVRLPTLSWLIAALTPIGARLLLLFLAVLTIIAWAYCLTHLIELTTLRMASGIVLIFLGVFPAMMEPAIWYSETWAGLLIALSLAMRGSDRWWPSVMVGLAAVLFRELALAYLLAMGLLALVEGRRREAVGWGCVITLFALVYFGHALAVNALTVPSDPVSQGWNGQGGWAQFIFACWFVTTFVAFPPFVVALLLPVAYFGLGAWNTPVTVRALVTLVGYTLLIALFARVNNVYWIWLISPMLGLGLLFAPFALADLIRSVLTGAAACQKNDHK